jgi:uncharacterized repeat protein (TIGR01451 family)
MMNRLLAAFVLLLIPVSAAATVNGQYPLWQRDFQVFGDRAVTGNSLMTHFGFTNTALIAEGTEGRVNTIPDGATITAAYLFWSGTVDNAIDRSVDFTFANGSTINDLSVDVLQPGESPESLQNSFCMSHDKSWSRRIVGQNGRPFFLTADMEFFYCRREITELLADRGPVFNGQYGVSDVEALPGWPADFPAGNGIQLDGQSGCYVDMLGQGRIDERQQVACQTSYAGWSVVIIWEHPTARVRRDVVLYDGFVLMDDDPQSGGLINFDITDFRVGESALGEFAFFGLEGDEQLGSGQAVLDPDNPLFCDVCPDFVSFATNGSPNPTQLSNEHNRVGNLWNGTVQVSGQGGGATPGVDIDSYDIGAGGLGLLRENDTTASLRAGTGDGQAGGRVGGGELVFLGWSGLSLDTFSPSLNGAGTSKSVFPPEAGPGDLLFYTVDIENDGSAEATEVVVRDLIPTGSVYVPNTTTTTCGVAAPDVGGTSPLVTGLNLGTLPFEPPTQARCTVRFQVRVADDASPGSRITNSASISSVEQAQFATNQVQTRIVGPELGTPTKTVSNTGGGPFEPGDLVAYEISVHNSGSSGAAGITVTDVLPEELTYRFETVPPGVVANYDAPTRTLTFTGVSVGGNLSAVITVYAAIRGNVSGGALVSNQARVTADFLNQPLLTDDPTTNDPVDPTVFGVVDGPDLSTSTKVGVDDDGAPLVPGNTVRYTLSLTNTGNQPGIVTVNDALQAPLTGCAVISMGAGLNATCNGDTLSVTGVVPPGATRSVVFTAVVGAAADGTPVQNTALVAIEGKPDVPVVAANLVVGAGGLLVTSTLDAIDLDGAPLAPADSVRLVITVRNSGGADVSNLAVNLPLDNRLVFQSATLGGQAVPGAISWSALPAIGAGETLVIEAVVRLQANLDSGTRISVFADLSADDAPDFRTDTVELVIDAEPTLTLQKTVEDLNGGDFRPGDFVRYSLTLNNSGAVPANALVLTDEIPDGLVDVTADGGGVVAAENVVWNGNGNPSLTRLLAGETVALTFTARITSPMEDGREISNQARLVGSDIVPLVSDNPATALDADPTTFVVTSETTVVLEKVDEAVGDGAYAPGSEVRYVLRLGIGGDQTARGAEISDTLPDELVFVSADPPPQVAGQTLTWTGAEIPALSTLDPGAEVFVEVVVRIDPRALTGDSVRNAAQVTADVFQDLVVSNDPDTPIANDPTVFLVGGTPNLTVTKRVFESVADNAFRVGERVRYVVSLTNNGDADLVEITLVDVLDEHLLGAQVEGDWGLVVDGRVEGTVARLQAGASLDLAFEATLAAAANGTVIQNQAVVLPRGAPEPILSDDPDLPGDADMTDLTLVAEEGVSIIKTVTDLNGGEVLPGDRLTYQLRVVNTGEAVMASATITDAFDDRLIELVLDSEGELVGQLATWRLVNLEPGEPQTIQVSARVAPNTEPETVIDNQALARWGDGDEALSDDGDPDNGSDNPTSVTVGVPPAPELVATKTVQPESVQRGGEATWTITLRNVGDAPLNDYTFSDLLASELSVLEVVGAQAAGNAVSASGSLDPDAEHVITVRTAVLPSAGASISNQASIALAGLADVLTDDPRLDGDSDPTELTVEGAALDPWLDKQVEDLDGGQVLAGDELRYTLTLTNRGTEPFVAATLRDVLDDSLILVEDSFRFGDQPVPVDRNVLAAGMPLDVPVPPGAQIVATFVVRVADGVPNGTSIANQAVVVVANEDVFSDDPELPGGPQATVVVVGASGALQAVKRVSPSEVAPGETAQWEIELATSAAELVTVKLSDVIPAGVAYQAGSMRLDGQSVSDANDGDGVSFDALSQTVALEIDLGPQRRGARFSFTTVATASDTVISNQATTDVGGVPGLSDGVPEQPGDQATELRISPAPADLSGSRLEVSDVDGGVVLAGDVLRYQLTLRNVGDRSVTLPVGGLENRLQAGVTYLATGDQPAGFWQQDGAVLKNAEALTLAAEEAFVVTWQATLSADLSNGTRVSNSVEVVDPVRYTIGPADVVIGERPPGALVRGTVFLGANGKTAGLSGWRVAVIDPQSDELAKVADTDAEGVFEVSGIAWANAELRVSHPSGARFLTRSLSGLNDGDERVEDCAIDPSGVIYDSVNGLPIAGATVQLLYDASGEPVLESDLPEGQQNQVTGNDGFYRFDVKPPHLYRLSVQPPGGFHSFPSLERQPEGGTPARRFGRPSRMAQAPDLDRFHELTDEAGDPVAGRAVVPSPVPDLDRPLPYFLRFDIRAENDAVFHNHVPLDPLRKQILLTRSASKLQLSGGDLVTFTVRIVNRSSTVLDDQLDGGVTLLDLLPPGVRPLARADGGLAEAFEKMSAGGARARLTNLRSTGTGQLRSVTGFVIRPGDTLIWTYRAQVLAGLPSGTLITANQLLTAQGGTTVADPARVDLIVTADPLLQESSLIGRVYCDRDDDDHFSVRDIGMPGVRIYADNGVYIDTDASGRYHFSRLTPGAHRIKIDARSLPPGVSLRGDLGRTFVLTPGLPAAIDFATHCPKDLVAAEQVAGNALADGVGAPPPPRPLSPLTVVADPSNGRVAVGGVDLLGPSVDATASVPDQEPWWGRGLGPNLDPVETRLDLYSKVLAHQSLAAWAWYVATPSGAIVWEKKGQGAPPQRLRWSIADSVQRGKRYIAWLEVTDAGGDVGTSWMIPIGLGYNVEAEKRRNRAARINEVNGVLFVDDGATPTPRYRGWFQDRLARLQADGSMRIEVRIHGGAWKSKAADRSFTDRRARTVRSMLLAEGIAEDRFTVRSMGNTKRVAPERSRKITRLNRRIEWRYLRRAMIHPPLDPEHPIATHLLVNGQGIEAGEDGTFKTSVPAQLGEVVRVDLVTAAGARRVLRRIRHGEALEALAPLPGAQAGVQVDARLRGERGLKVGGVSYDLSALSVRLRPMRVALRLDAEGKGLQAAAEGDEAPCSGVCFGTSSDMAMEGWELRLFNHGIDGRDDKERLIHTLKAVGPMPPLLNWDGRKPGGAFILSEGVYGARLIVRGKGGVVGISRPAFFRVYRNEEAFRVVLSDPFGAVRRTKMPALKLTDENQKNLTRFVGLAKRLKGPIQIVGHTDVRLRAARAASVSNAMAEALRKELVARGVQAGRITVSGKGSSQRVVKRARNAKQHAENRRVELLLASEEQKPLPQLEGGMSLIRSATGDLVADAEGVLKGRLLPAADGSVTLRLEDGSGRTAVMPMKVNVPPPMAPVELVPVVPLVASGGLAIPETEAISLRVALPENGSLLRHQRLGLYGVVALGQRVTVNGAPVGVDPRTGRFGYVLDLGLGKQSIEVVAEDAQGHRARVLREVMVDPSGDFLLVLADMGYASAAVQLPGMRLDRGLDLGAYGSLSGRAAAWYKRRWNEPEGYFKKYRLSAYIDTDRARFESLARDLGDLRLVAPEWGDDAKEVEEVKAAGPVFVDLWADASRLRIANFATDLPGRELLKYRRSFYGLNLLFDRNMADPNKKKKVQQVTAEVYASDTAQGLRSASNLFRATGGSFYRLRHRSVLPGSPRVEVTVRDRTSGLVLHERTLVEGRDYRLDSAEGLLILETPLPASAGSGFAGDLGVSSADLGGHPVFLMVRYTYRAIDRLATYAAGGRVDYYVKHLGLRTGVSYNIEGRTDGASAFQAAGVFAQWRHRDGHRASTEFGWSRSIDGDHYLSADGGSQFSRLGEDPSQTALMYNDRIYPVSLALDGNPRTGIGFKIDGASPIGRLVGLKAKDDLALDAYVRHTSAGFYGGGALLDQGQTRWGTGAVWKATKKDRALLRYDASLSLMPAPMREGALQLPEPALREYRRIHREMLTLRYERKEKRYKLGGEYNLGFTGDSWNYVDEAQPSLAMTVSHGLAVDGDYKIDERWTVGGAQRVTLGGDDLRFSDPFARIASVARARYALRKTLAVEAEEELRWNGDNQTRISLVRQPDKKTRQYLQERFTQQSGGFFNSTVVGAEQRPKKGHSNRVEMNVQHSGAGPRNSAVIGLARRYRVAPGLHLNWSYERTQVLSGAPAYATAVALPAAQQPARGADGRVLGTSDLVGQPTSPAVATGLLQSGMNGWGTAPVTGSRDALAVSGTWVRKRRWNLTSRHELRMDFAADVDLDNAFYQDRLTQFHQLAGRLRLNSDLSVLGRVALAEVYNLTAAAREHHAQEVSIGVALRPQHTDAYRGLLRYTRRRDLRGDGLWLSKDLLAVEPIFETPWFTQITTKLALKSDAEADSLLGEDRVYTGLFIGRADFHLTRLWRRQKKVPFPGDLDLWAEYRTTANLSAGALEHGVALGVAYLPVRRVRIGLGYSFTAIPEALSTADAVDGSGFFVRVTGAY